MSAFQAERHRFKSGISLALHRDTMKINLWYSKGMSQWRWTLVDEWKNGNIHIEQHSGQQPHLRNAMNDIANTVEYLLEVKEQVKKT
jgi:hypothetical protein